MRWAKDGPRIGWYLVPINKSAGLLLLEIVKDIYLRHHDPFCSRLMPALNMSNCTDLCLP